MKSNSVDYVRDIRLHIGPAPKGLKPRDSLKTEQRDRYTDQLKDCGWLDENLFEFSTKKVYSEFTVWASELIQESIRIQTKNDKRMPVHFLIRGEPSIGKTTELKKIVQSVLNETTDLDLYPLYSEFQYAQNSEEEMSSIWNDIVSGCCISEFKHAPHSSSFRSYVDFAVKNKRQPVLFIDTLDILLLDKMRPLEDQWNLFLNEATQLNVPVVWTCRPSEWRIIEKPLSTSLKRQILEIELPYLKQSGIDAFPFTPTFQDSMNDLQSATHGWNILSKEMWDDWTQRLQAYVPLFAHRASSEVPHRKNLAQANGFFQKLQEVFSLLVKNKVGNKTPHQVLDGSQWPTSLYYQSLKSSISERLQKSHSLTKNECEQFFKIFEGTIQDLVAKERRTFRLQFSLHDVHEALIEQNFEHDHIGDIFDICESFGLIQQFGRRFEFSHQLLFEEVLFLSEKKSDFSYFPSIQIRLQDNQSSDLTPEEIDENMESFLHWTGGLLSYLPEVRAEQPDIPTVWNTWIDFAHQNTIIYEEYSKTILTNNLSLSSWSENAEKRNILKRFIENKSSGALYLNGAPGTGKTYFCFNFLEHHLISEGNRNSLDWRYVTLSSPLVDHFKREWERYKIDEKTDPRIASYDRIDEKINRSIGARSIEELLGVFLPNLNQVPDSSQLRGTKYGMLTFNRFKELITNYYDEKKIQVNRPSTSDAWHDYRNFWHNPVTGEPNKRDESAPNDRMQLNSRDFGVFIDFIQTKLSKWKLLEELCYLAIQNIAKLSAAERSLHQHDLLMIDEVQDLPPCVLTFLLCLTRRRFDSKRILIAGDRLQTVNRSGFEWKSFRELSFQSLQEQCRWIAQDEFKALEDLLIDPHGSDYPIETLRTPWRNAPRITKFNDLMRSSFGEYYGARESFADYAVEANSPSQEVKDRDEHSKITICMAETYEDYTAFLNLIQSVESDITMTSDVAVLTPYGHMEEKLRQFQSFAMFDGDSVKGLEFDGVIVAQPYELLSDEAATSIGLGNQNSATIDEQRIKAWFSSNTEQSKNKRDLFLSLYDNIRTRMNVLFSRPKFSLLILLRSPFGHGLQEHEDDAKNPHRNTRYFDIPNPTIIDPDYINRLQISFIDTHSANKQDIIDALRLPEGVGDTSGASRIQRAIQAEQMREGSSVTNIVNLWRNLLQDPDIGLAENNTPTRSARLLSGSFDLSAGKNAPATILYALRKGTIKPERKIRDFIYSKNNVCERFLFNLNLLSKSTKLEGPVKGTYRSLRTIPYHLYADFHDLLPTLMHEVLFESLTPGIIRPYPKILATLMAECFGITDIEIDGDAKFIQVSKRMTLLIDSNLIEQNDGLVVKYTPPSFEELLDKISSHSEEIILDEGNDFDSILLTIIDNLNDFENRGFFNRCIRFLESSNQSLQHLLVPELESAFWAAAKEIEPKRIPAMLAKIGPFLEARTSMYCVYPELAKTNPKGVWADAETENKKPAEHYRLPKFTPNEEGELYDLESTAYSECITAWASHVNTLSEEALQPIARIAYHLTWYTKQLPSANMCSLLIQDWHEGTSSGYEELIDLWWNHIADTFRLSEQRSIIPRDDLEKRNLLALTIPGLAFLERKKETNSQHVPMQRVWLRRIINTCHSIYINLRKEQSTPSDKMRQSVRNMLNVLFNPQQSKKRNSGYVRFNLNHLISQDLAQEILPLLALNSLYTEDQTLRKDINFETRNPERLFKQIFSEYEKSLFTEVGEILQHEKAIENMVNNFRWYSNASVDRIYDKPWWSEPNWKGKPSQIRFGLTRTHCLHWQALIDLVNCLKTSPPKNILPAFTPHRYLFPPHKKNEKQNVLGQFRFNIAQFKQGIGTRKHEVRDLRNLMTWFYHSPSSGESADFPANRKQPNTRSVLLKHILHETGQIHQLDWELILMMSTSTRYTSVERLETPWVEFDDFCDALGYALATNLDALEIMRSDNTIEESIEILRLASSTMTSHADDVTNFIRFLEDPHNELRARFKNEIDSNLKNWKMPMPWWEKKMEHGHNKNFQGEEYHKNLLSGLNTFLLERGGELFKSQFNDN